MYVCMYVCVYISMCCINCIYTYICVCAVCMYYTGTIRYSHLYVLSGAHHCSLENVCLRLVQDLVSPNLLRYTQDAKLVSGSVCVSVDV